MSGSRTIKSLTALVMAMTVGTFLLMLLELKADPVRCQAESLAAAAERSADFRQAILQTELPFQPMKWRNIVVHSVAHAADQLAEGCHFVIRSSEDGRGWQVQATDRWKRQADGRHVLVPAYDYNRNTIGVCLIGEFSSRPPERGQFEALVALVRQLRRQCHIPPDHVYLARQLPLPRKSPGQAFPAELFDQLIREPLR